MLAARLGVMVLRRMVLALATLWLVTLIIFFSTHALPGDLAISILGTQATEETLQALRAALHLNEPVWVQYLRWVSGVARLDFGVSATQANQPIITIVGPRVVNSLFLVSVAAAISIPLALVLAIVAATRPGGKVDNVIAVLNLTFASVPQFVIGTALVILFGTTVFRVLPAVSLLNPARPVWTQLPAIILPAVTLALAVAPYISRVFRAQLIEVLESEYVQMALLKGLSARAVMLRHALPNALVPAINVIAIQISLLVAGTVVVEQVFQFNGIGTALLSAVNARDLPIVQLISLVIAAVYILMNLVGDILTILLTPRLRTGQR